MNDLDTISETARCVLGCVLIVIFGIVGAALLAQWCGVLTQ